MDVNLILNKYGKNICDENMLEKVYNLSSIYDMDLTEISTMLAIYLLSNEIADEDITFNTFLSFEKEKLMSHNKSKEKGIIKSQAVNKQKKEILIKSDFFEQYQDGGNVTVICNVPMAEPLDVSTEQFVYETSDCDMDDNSEVTDFIWPVNLYSVDEKYEYMYQLNQKISNICEKHGLDLTRERLEKRNAGLVDDSNHIHMKDLSAVNKIGQEVYTCGIIVIDHSHTDEITNSNANNDDMLSIQSIKLTPDNIAIQGYSSIQLAAVPLNLEKTSSYSFFPGQNVILKGHNSSKTGFVISEQLPNHVNACLPISSSDIPANLRIMIASGPFSLKNTDNNQYLGKLIATLKDEHCNLLVLTGPFIDCENEALELRNETELYSTMLYEKLLFVTKSCISLNVQVIFVPSTKDTDFSTTEFPQPKFEVPNDIKEFRHPLVHFAPNPSLFTIGPISFGVTSVDILRHMSLQEINKNHTKGITRHCRHILQENNLYPLITCHPEVNVDWTMWPRCHLGPNPPHCLILPSMLSTFKEDVDGVCCINPGHVANENYGGTCAIMTVVKTKIVDGATSIGSATQCRFIRL